MIGLYEFLVVLAMGGPALLLWIAVVILAAVRLRRGGGSAERFLIAGGGLKIISNLLGIAGIFAVPWLIDRGYDHTYAVSLASGYGIFSNIISMAGIICLIYAFWVKFKARDSALVESTS